MTITIDWKDGTPRSLTIKNVTGIGMDEYDFHIFVKNDTNVRQFGRDAIAALAITDLKELGNE